ncbi:MAG: hypothetical protein HQK50_11710 [Oligoflexia bacterium]|nr:hypothetical protein [Oligoflexia bacterium]MBF0366230.1 hypothetical protein [Oligoflexia bacterium]
MKKTDLKKFAGLEYLTIKDVPIRSSKHGDVIDVNYGKLERMAAKFILQQKIPIRGKEIKLLRSVTRMSMAELGKALGVSANAVMHWEKEGDKRLLPINEMIVRAFFCSELEVEFPKCFDDLKSNLKRAKKILLKAS